MDMKKLLDKVCNDYYTLKKNCSILNKVPTTFIFDEDLSVRKNKELAEEYNRLIDKEKQDCRESENSLHKEFRDDCIAAIINESSLTPIQAEIVFNYSYRLNHSEGKHAVASGLYELIEFAETLIK